MLARLQQLITLVLVTAAIAWLLFFWEASFVIALAGFAMLILGYSGFLALEFVALRFVNRNDPAPQPTWGQLAKAWMGETMVAPRIFCWRQPFRSKVMPDHLPSGSALTGKRGVVLIHGFFCNRGFWTPWLEKLRTRGHAYVAVNLEPPFSSIDDYAPLIDEAVKRATAATGHTPVLVCHSMGGLAARAWLKVFKAEARAYHVITIGTPHRGTWLARFSRLTNGRQMQLSGSWHRELDIDMPERRHSLFTCWYSNCDNIVFPCSTATLPGADNRLVLGAAHVQLAFHSEVMSTSMALIEGDSWKSAH